MKKVYMSVLGTRDFLMAVVKSRGDGFRIPFSWGGERNERSDPEGSQKCQNKQKALVNNAIKGKPGIARQHNK